MRVVGFTLVRNEEDVIEASIRHNLRSLDALSVIDHGSDDATPEILAALAGEGLPIDVRRDDAIELRLGAVTTEGVRRILADGADLCIPIDADEFLRMPSRERFDAAVSAADPAHHLVMPCFTYLPALDAPGDIVSRLAHARRKADGRPRLDKVVVRRTLLDTPGARVDTVNHRVYTEVPGPAGEHAALPGSVATVAHVPIRSAGQFAAKVAVGCLAVRLADLGDKDVAFPWQEAFDDLVAGKPFTNDRLAEIAANYRVAREHRVDPATVAWLDDPLPLDVALRYTPSRPPNPLARILTFGERVAAEVARTTGGL